MRGEIERGVWGAYLDDFSRRNRGRAARLDVMGEEVGAGSEAGVLPFAGISFDNKGSAAPAVQVMLGGSRAAGVLDLTHTVAAPRRVVAKAGADGRDEALEIEAGDGTRTILVFEVLPELPGDTLRPAPQQRGGRKGAGGRQMRKARRRRSESKRLNRRAVKGVGEEVL